MLLAPSSCQTVRARLPCGTLALGVAAARASLVATPSDELTAGDSDLGALDVPTSLVGSGAAGNVALGAVVTVTVTAGIGFPAVHPATHGQRSRPREMELLERIHLVGCGCDNGIPSAVANPGCGMEFLQGLAASNSPRQHPVDLNHHGRAPPTTDRSARRRPAAYTPNNGSR